jgi:uncharacterized membrane protein YcfT
VPAVTVRPPPPAPGQLARAPVPPHARAPEGRGRIDWLDAGRGLAITLVVLLHAEQWLRTAGIDTGPVLKDVNAVVAGLRMPLFFTVSGFLAARWISRAWPDVLSVKVLVLVWAYLMWQPVGSLAAVVASWFTGDELTPMRMLVSLAATPVRPRFELWFLWALALFFVLAKVTARIPVRFQLAGAAAVAAVWFSGFLPQDGNLGWNGVPKFYLFFLIGAHHRRLVAAFAERLTWLRSVALIALWAGAAAAAYVTGYGTVVGVGLVTSVLGMAAGIALALALSWLAPLRALGSRTLQVYLAHNPIIIVMAWQLHTRREEPWVDVVGPALPVAAAGVAILGAIALHAVAIRTPARLMYVPPSFAGSLVRAITSGPAGRRVGPRHAVGDDAPVVESRARRGGPRHAKRT